MEKLDSSRMFVAVMETGSFAAAAQRLGTSHGQASKLITRLEHDLGIQLFKRSTRAMAPTDVAVAYYDRIKLLLEEYDALNDSVRNASESPAGKIRITVPVTFGTTQLSHHLIAFAQRFPHIELDVNFSDRQVNVVDEGYDLALRIGALADSSLIARKLCAIRVIIVASPDYLEQRGVPETWQQLSRHDCIVDTNFRDAFRWPFLDASQHIQELPIGARLKFSNADVCLQAACAGLGITRVPTFVAGDRLRSQQVIPLLTQYEVPPLGLFALYPPAKHLARKSRTLIDFLVEALSGQPAWDQGW
ncbi:LysR family transcriptional regulator [Rahnella sp. SAP-1]|uniref:LysR family transcriptional regulator n=1 Tax=Rouxiella aceris TaxID=2703884 RepID=A0A848MBV5_9GAMM|nr:LysR family transcriptional regulator [Rouxiella aceris]NMP25587.1 LysR family transcriptional regulator [Rouxiella aceris]